jgi:RimJ/RimL family protein N-acetyltransferase
MKLPILRHLRRARESGLMAMPLTTPRLTIREVRAADALALWSLHGDPDVARWMGNGQPLTLALCEAWIQVSLRNYRERGYGHCLLEDRQSGDFIGGCGIVHPALGDGSFGPAEIIYALLPGCWGLGLGTEAAAAMLAWGAREHGLHEVLATVDPSNEASAAVLRKLGLTWLHTRPDADGLATATWRWQSGLAGACPPQSTT